MVLRTLCLTAIVLALSLQLPFGALAQTEDEIAKVDDYYRAGISSYIAGDYQSALISFNDAYAITSNEFPEGDLQALLVTGYLALINTELGRYADAEPFSKRTLAGMEKVLGPEHPQTLISVNNLAVIYEALGRYVEAEELYDRALEAATRLLGEEDPNTLAIVHSLADLYRVQSRYAEAEPLYLRALEAKKRVLGADHRATLNSASSLGGLYQAQGRYAEAEALVLSVLETRERVLGVEHLDTLSSVNNLAGLYMDQARYVEAYPLLKRTLEARERLLGSNNPETLNGFNNLAVLYDAQGRYGEAETLYRHVLEARESVLGIEHPETIDSVRNLANLYNSQGRYAEAEPLYNRALNTSERVLGDAHPDTLSRASGLAILYLYEGRYAEAEPLLQRALLGLERLLGAKHPLTLSNVNNLAFLYYSQGRYAEAEPLYKRALEAQKVALGAEHPDTLLSASNLAHLYYSQGRYTEAEAFLKRVIEGNERLLGPEHPDTLRGVNDLAALKHAQGRYAEAEPLYMRVLEASERVLGAENPATLAVLNNFAVLLLSKSEPDYAAADELLNKGLDGAMLRLQRGLLAGASDAGLESLVRDVSSRDLALSLAATDEGRDQIGARALLVTKAMAGEIAASLARVIATSADPATRALAQDLQVAESELAAANFGSDPARIAPAREARDRLHRQLLQRESGLATFLEPGQLTPDAIQALVEPGTILIDFAIYDPVDFATGQRQPTRVARVVYRADEAPVMEDLGLYHDTSTEAKVDIAREVERLAAIGALQMVQTCQGLDDKAGVAGGCPAPEELARLAALVDGDAGQTIRRAQLRLSYVLLGGIDPEGQAKKLVIAPDGALFRINFALLGVTPTAPLMETHELQIVPSLRVLLPGFEGAAPIDAGFFAAGGGDYGPMSAETAVLVGIRSPFRGGGFFPLPGAEEEALSLTRLFESGGQITRPALTGAAAIEADVKALMPGTRILHLATHAGQGLSKGGTGLYDVALAFSGANATLLGSTGFVTADKDGLLSGYEASRLALYGTELVTLSACDTALGTDAGSEGFYSLAYAFRLAGAENVLMSLWKVDDAKTREFMQMLYEEWLDRRRDHPDETSGEGLRRALRTTMNTARAMKNPDDPDTYHFGIQHYAAFVLVEN